MKKKVLTTDLALLFPELENIGKLPRKMKKEFKKNIAKRFYIELNKWQEDPENWKNEFLNK
jgi:hypothetical protein